MPGLMNPQAQVQQQPQGPSPEDMLNEIFQFYGNQGIPVQPQQLIQAYQQQPDALAKDYAELQQLKQVQQPASLMGQ